MPLSSLVSLTRGVLEILVGYLIRRLRTIQKINRTFRISKVEILINSIHNDASQRYSYLPHIVYTMDRSIG